MPKIAAIILAAGGSSRLGKPKQLLNFKGKSLLRGIIDAAAAAVCSPVLVVTGSVTDALDHELIGTNATAIENKNWQLGIGSSIRTGIQHLIGTTSDIDAVVFLACDQPFVSADTIKDLIAAGQSKQKPIVASNYAETLGVPALFDRSFFGRLLALDDIGGAKSLILSHPESVAGFPFPQGEVDIDTADDWQRFAHEGDATATVSRRKTS